MSPQRLLALTLLIFPLSVFAQAIQFDWVNTVGGTSSDYSLAVGTDVNGNVYTMGTFSGTVDMDSGPGVFNMTSEGLIDIFITKSDANGNLVWVKQIGDNNPANEGPRNMVVDPAGNLYITGSFYATLDFDPGPGIANLICPGTGYAAFLLKLDKDGNFVWAHNIAQSDYGNIGYSVDVASSGNVYVVGTFKGLTDFDPGPVSSNVNSSSQNIFISKFDNGGNFLWSKQFSGTMGQVGYSIKVDAQENIYTTGLFSGISDFDPGAGVYSLAANTDLQGSWSDAFVTKLDSHGNFIWAKKIDGLGDQIGFGLAIDPSGNIVIVGEFHGDTDFDPGPGVFTLSSTAIKGFVLRLNSNGEFLWVRELSGTGATVQPASVACDALGNVYVTGSFLGTADFDPGSEIYSLSSPSFSNVFISKLHLDGSFSFAKQVNADSYSHAYSITTDATDNIYVSGYFSNTADFDPEAGEYLAITNGSLDGFVIKLAQCLQSTSETLTANVCLAYTANNQTYNKSGIYIQHLVNTAGCDSTLTLNLTIKGSVTTSNVVACSSFTWEGKTYMSTGNYSRAFSGSDGCDSILNLNLIIHNNTSSVINMSICDGQSYGGYSSSGTYVDVLQAANGCDSIRTLYLTVMPTPRKIFTIRICEGGNQWGYTTTGTYYDTLVAASGCDSIRILNLQVDPVKRNNVTVSLCKGESYYVNGIYQTSSGTYVDTVSTYLGCDSIVTTIITVHDSPIPDLGADRNLCMGSNISLTPGLFASYQWQDQTTGASLTIYNPGTYWVAVKNSNGCLAVDSIVITGTAPKPADFLKPVDSICQYGQLHILPAKHYMTYKWSDGSNGASLTVDKPGRYILQVQDYNGCYGSDTSDVFYKICRTGVFIPTAFTPNGDGINDVFRAIVFGKVLNFKLDIYNRWGELVFSTTDPYKSWDGKSKMNDNATSAFVWRCSYQLEGGKLILEKGLVTLTR
ncbi:MAG: SBBP repeat-containing protein [Agriterribacter sp.]